MYFGMHRPRFGQVDLGTSTPELPMEVISKVRGHDAIGLGAIVGSNVFNSLFIVACAATIGLIEVKPKTAGAWLGIGWLTTRVTDRNHSGLIGRSCGVNLLAGYGARVCLLLRR